MAVVNYYSVDTFDGTEAVGHTWDALALGWAWLGRAPDASELAATVVRLDGLEVNTVRFAGLAGSPVALDAGPFPA